MNIKVTMYDNIENNVLINALDVLGKNISMPIDWEIKELEIECGKSFDKIIKITIRDIDLFFCSEIKQNVTKATIGLLLHQKEHFPHPPFLIANYINPNMAEELKLNGIQFIDAAGNVFIDNFPIYIYITGKKSPDIDRQILPGRAFRPSGLKMIYAILCNPDLLNKPYRDIAAVADISLGTIGLVIKDLINFGYVLDMGKKGKKLQQKKALFDRWCTEYNEKLKPNLLVGRFDGPDNWWKKCHLNPDDAQWGGEVATFILTKYLKPQTVSMYVDRHNVKNIIIENKLFKSAHGEIEILARFWRRDESGKYGDTVHPMLIYADLIGTGDQRNIEAARGIYDKYINGYLGED